MSDEQSTVAGEQTVNITVNGKQVTAREGEMLITAADRAGVYIPRFCYHPRMKPVGMCRMCLVDVKGPRGFSFMPACYTPVAEGQEVVTDSERVKKVQDDVLELLLVNHPLDCPVCDKGGECPLQDQTLAYGPGETRFIEEKRHWEKPIPLSELVYLDRERCIQCARCTRFADEVAGDPLIDFAGRGDQTEVAVFTDTPYQSNFSGNVVQICPVGALTAKPYRFKARPWDLEQVESSCTSCSVGCRVAVQSSSDEVTRYNGIDSDPVNWSWLCDKGRFDYGSVNSSERLASPMVRQGNELVEVSWAQALSDVARRLNFIAGSRIGVIGGARLANEDAYAWAKLARTVLHTDNVDAQLGDGLPAKLVAGLPRATIDQACAAPLVITLAGDLKEELPVLYLRLRHAAVESDVPIVELSSHSTGLSPYCAQSLVYRPGEAAALVRALTGTTPIRSEVAGVAPETIEAVRALLAQAWEKGHSGEPSVVVVLGRPSLAESQTAIVDAAQVLAGLPGVAFLSALRRSNVHGAIDAGMAPGLLPGRVGLQEGRAWFERQWNCELPPAEGMDTEAMLRAAVAGDIEALLLVGADPIADFPDRALARAALDAVPFVVSIDCFLNDSVRQADIVLPAAGYAERRGSFTNIEGRITWLAKKVTPPGVAWPDWMIAAELASRLEADLGAESIEQLWAELEHLSPLHHGVSNELLVSRQARDGIVVPISANVSSTAQIAVPALLDPMADPGVSQVASHAAAPPVLAVAGAGVDRDDVTEDVSSGHEAGMPQMLVTEAAGAPPEPPGRDQYSLRLVTTRPMWDGGTWVNKATGLAGLAEPLVVKVHPTELERLGVRSGEKIRVMSARSSIEIPAQADVTVPRGVATMAFNLIEGGAGELIEAGHAVNDVRLETIEPVGGVA